MRLMPAFARTDAHSQHVERREVPVPVPGANEVLVAVEAFGVGVHDRYFLPQQARFPYVIGIEGAGRVEPGATAGNTAAPGQRVAFISSLQPQGGTWAPFAVVRRDALVPVPPGLDSCTAAALPVAGRTALQALTDLDPAPDSTLFIAGASGAIGTLAVQLARQRGARVAASASPGNHDYLRALGAELAVDYRAEGWQQVVFDWAGRGVDAALAIQPGTGSASIAAVRTGGQLLTVSGDAAQVVPERRISVAQMRQPQGGTQPLAALLGALAAGHIRVVVEARYPFDDALQALQKVETRHARGKVVVQIQA